jgi:hypothetical protein
MPLLPPAIPAGLPSQLLERRPDIREAEQLLVAANANIGVAKANFFPTISLTGLLGVVSPELSNLFTNSGTWSIAAGLVGPLFHGGQLRSEYKAAQAQWQQVRVQYEATVTSAFGEVSTALIDRTKLVDTVRSGPTATAYRKRCAGFIRYLSACHTLRCWSGNNFLRRMRWPSQNETSSCIQKLYRSLADGIRSRRSPGSSVPAKKSQGNANGRKPCFEDWKRLWKTRRLVGRAETPDSSTRKE